MNEAELVNEKSIRKHSNLIIRLWRGDVRLRTTYWVYSFLVGSLIGLAYTIFIGENYISIASDPYGRNILIFLFIFVLVYQMFISVAVWRSAGKYKGSKLWPVLARTSAVFGIIVGVLQAAVAFTPKSVDASMRQQAEFMNGSAPVMLDEHTRLDNVVYVDKKFVYNYSIVTLSRAEMDVDRFRSSMELQLKTAQCEGKATREMLRQLDKISFLYRDKDGSVIARFDITEGDCT